MSVHDTWDNVNLCGKTGFEKAGILLTLGFAPTQKSRLEAFEKEVTPDWKALIETTCSVWWLGAEEW